MASLFQSGKYGAINTADTTANGYYVIQFISEAQTLKNNTKIDRKIIYVGKLVVKAKHLFSMQENTHCYWQKQPLQHTIIVPTRTILYPRLDVVGITYVQDIPKTICNRIQANRSIQRHPIFLTDAYYGYTFNKIKR